RHRAPPCLPLHLPPRSLPSPYTTLFRSKHPTPPQLLKPFTMNMLRIYLHRELKPTVVHLAHLGQTPQVERRGPAHHSPIRLFLQDRKSTRLNSSHVSISYAAFCLNTKTV